MKLFTNRIFTGQSKTLDAFIKEASDKRQIKTASTNVKVAEDSTSDKDGEVHVKMQPGDPCCGTDTGEIIEGDEKIEASAVNAVKVATKDEAKGVKHKVDEVGGTNTAKKEESVYPDKKASNVNRSKKAESDAPAGDKKSDYGKIPNSGGRTHDPDKCCGAPSSAGQDGSENEKSKSKSESGDSGEKKEAKVNFEGVDWSKLTAFANLKSSEKAKFKDYWRNIYGEDFSEAMAQDR